MVSPFVLLFVVVVASPMQVYGKSLHPVGQWKTLLVQTHQLSFLLSFLLWSLLNNTRSSGHCRWWGGEAPEPTMRSDEQQQQTTSRRRWWAAADDEQQMMSSRWWQPAERRAAADDNNNDEQQTTTANDHRSRHHHHASPPQIPFSIFFKIVPFGYQISKLVF